MKIENKPFLVALLEQEIITEEEARRLTSHHDHYQLLLHVIHNGAMRSAEACKLWADSLGVAWVDLRKVLFQPEVVQRLPKDFQKENALIPLYQMGERVSVAMADPRDRDVIEKAERLLNAKISPAFALKADILDAIEIQHNLAEDIENLSLSFDSASFPIKREVSKSELIKVAGDKSIIELTRSLMLLAAK